MIPPMLSSADAREAPFDRDSDVAMSEMPRDRKAKKARSAPVLSDADMSDLSTPRLKSRKRYQVNK